MKKIPLSFVFLVATASFGQPAPPVVPLYPYQYAAKIVCGSPIVTPAYPYQVGAKGTYFTQVNIHNPSRTQGVSIRKKFINALPNERPSKPTQFFNLGLEPDWATQIDCHNIASHGLIGYVEGFVIIESSLELDVVGLYTAEGPGALISTMEIDRVPVRRMPTP